MQGEPSLVDFRQGLPRTVAVYVRNGQAELARIDTAAKTTCCERKAVAYLAVGYSIAPSLYEVYTRKSFRVVTTCNDFKDLQAAAAYHEACKKLELFTKGRWRLDLAALFDVSVKQGTEEESLETELVGVPLYSECLNSSVFEDVEKEAISYTGIAIRAGWQRFPSIELKARIMPSSCCYVAFLKG